LRRIFAAETAALQRYNSASVGGRSGSSGVVDAPSSATSEQRHDRPNLLTLLNPMGCPRVPLYGHSAATHDGFMYVFGGATAEPNEFSNDLHRFNFSTFVWSEVIVRGSGGSGPFTITPTTPAAPATITRRGTDDADPRPVPAAHHPISHSATAPPHYNNYSLSSQNNNSADNTTTTDSISNLSTPPTTSTPTGSRSTSGGGRPHAEEATRSFHSSSVPRLLGGTRGSAALRAEQRRRRELSAYLPQLHQLEISATTAAWQLRGLLFFAYLCRRFREASLVKQREQRRRKRRLLHVLSNDTPTLAIANKKKSSDDNDDDNAVSSRTTISDYDCGDGVARSLLPDVPSDDYDYGEEDDGEGVEAGSSCVPPASAYSSNLSAYRDLWDFYEKARASLAEYRAKFPPQVFGGRPVLGVYSSSSPTSRAGGARGGRGRGGRGATAAAAAMVQQEWEELPEFPKTLNAMFGMHESSPHPYTASSAASPPNPPPLRYIVDSLPLRDDGGKWAGDAGGGFPVSFLDLTLLSLPEALAAHVHTLGADDPQQQQQQQRGGGANAYGSSNGGNSVGGGVSSGDPTREDAHRRHHRQDPSSSSLTPPPSPLYSAAAASSEGASTHPPPYNPASPSSTSSSSSSSSTRRSLSLKVFTPNAAARPPVTDVIAAAGRALIESRDKEAREALRRIFAAETAALQRYNSASVGGRSGSSGVVDAPSSATSEQRHDRPNLLTLLNPMGCPRVPLYGHSAATHDGFMYVFGGATAEPNEFSNDLHRFNFSTFVWSEVIVRGSGGSGPFTITPTTPAAPATITRRGTDDADPRPVPAAHHPISHSATAPPHYNNYSLSSQNNNSADNTTTTDSISNLSTPPTTSTPTGSRSTSGGGRPHAEEATRSFHSSSVPRLLGGTRGSAALRAEQRRRRELSAYLPQLHQLEISATTAAWQLRGLLFFAYLCRRFREASLVKQREQRRRKRRLLHVLSNDTPTLAIANKKKSSDDNDDDNAVSSRTTISDYDCGDGVARSLLPDVPSDDYDYGEEDDGEGVEAGSSCVPPASAYSSNLSAYRDVWYARVVSTSLHGLFCRLSSKSAPATLHCGLPSFTRRRREVGRRCWRRISSLFSRLDVAVAPRSVGGTRSHSGRG